MHKILLLALALLVGGLQKTAASDTTQKIDAYLSQLAVEKNFSGALLIIKNGQAVFSKGYGWADKARAIRFTPSTLASMGSITKAFSAAGIMKLVELSKLGLQDPLKKFFPKVPADKAGITLHQLLTHSSGFHEFLQDDGGDYAKIEKAVYTNVGMSILAIIIEQVSGLDYEVFLRQNLFDKIGCRIGYHYPVAVSDTIAIGYQNGMPWGTLQDHFATAGGGPYWNLKGNGGLEASLNDMLLWSNALTNKKILIAASLEKMFTPQVQEEGYGGQSYFGYGCNISKSRRNTKMIDNGGSNGIYFARLIRLPDEGLVFYMVTNESSINTNKVLPNITQLYFQGRIVDDALAQSAKFESPMSKQIYDLLEKPGIASLESALAKENIVVDDDMVLLEVGQALLLYQYYTKAFPKIVVAWNDMGDVYRMLHNNDAAKKCYQQALVLRPGNPRAIENLEKLKE